MADRGTVPALTYVFAIGITTILVSGLLIAGTGFINDQRERVVREELHVIGERVAVEIAAADRLSNEGGTVRQEVTVPERIGQTAYRMRVVDCPGHDACLRLTSADPEVRATATVPIMNETPVSVDRTGPRSVTITAEPGSNPSPAADADAEVNPNIGIAKKVVARGSAGTAFDGSVAPVVSGFVYAPTPPAMGESVTFSSEVEQFSSTDLTYKWDFDGDGTFDVVGNASNASTVSHTYANPGRYEVKFVAEEPSGTKDTVERTVRVSGLLYEGNTSAVAIDRDGDGEFAGLAFEVENNFASEDVNITDVLVNPVDPAVDELEEPGGGAEIIVDGAGVYYQPVTIYDSGGLATIDESSQPSIDDGDDADIIVGEFFDGGNQYGTFGHDWTFSIRYEIAGTKKNFVSAFTVDPSGTGGGGGGGNNAPVVDQAETYIDCDYWGDDDLYAYPIDVSDADGDLSEIRATVFDGSGNQVFSNSKSVSGGNVDNEYIYVGDYTDNEETIEVTVEDQNGNTDTVTRNVPDNQC